MLWPFWCDFWPFWFVAVFVYGRFGRGRFGLWLFWTSPRNKIRRKQSRVHFLGRPFVRKIIAMLSDRCPVPWRQRCVVASVVRRMNEVTLRRARSVLGWVTVFWAGMPSRYVTSQVEPTRSTQPCIPPGSLNRVPASAGVKAEMSPLPGGR